MLSAVCGTAGPVAAWPHVGIGCCGKAWVSLGTARPVLAARRVTAVPSDLSPCSIGPIPLGMHRVLRAPILPWVPGVEGLDRVMGLYRCLQHPRAPHCHGNSAHPSPSSTHFPAPIFQLLVLSVPIASLPAAGAGSLQRGAPLAPATPRPCHPSPWPPLTPCHPSPLATPRSRRGCEGRGRAYCDKWKWEKQEEVGKRGRSLS